MKHYYFITFLLLLSCSQAFAQKNFREGYIVQGTDTTKGYLDYRGSNKSAQIATFKSNLTVEAKKYTPADITAYGFKEEDKIFESKLILEVNDDSTKQQMRFLNVLAKGKVSIYYSRTDRVDHYYLQKDTLFVELENIKTQSIDSITGKSYQGYQKKYLGVLSYALLDCPTISNSQLENVWLDPSDLKKLARKYNQCIEPNTATTAYNQRAKSKVSVGLVLAYTQAQLQFMGQSTYHYSRFKSQSHIGGGVSLNIPLLLLNEKLSVQTELLYIPAKFTSPSSLLNSDYRFLFDLAYVKLPVQLRYTYPKGLVRPFINGGIMMGHIVKTNYDETLDLNVFPKALRDLVYGVTAGTGLTYPIQSRTISLELRYELNNGISDHSNYASTMNNYNLMLSYEF